MQGNEHESARLKKPLELARCPGNRPTKTNRKRRTKSAPSTLRIKAASDRNRSQLPLTYCSIYHSNAIAPDRFFQATVERERSIVAVLVNSCKAMMESLEQACMCAVLRMACRSFVRHLVREDIVLR